MKIKEFCKEYSNLADQLKKQYLKDNLKITTYVPFLTKDVLAQNIVNATTYKYENYTKEDGTIGRRKTNNINVNSIAQMLLFYRVVIENYTNLEVETEGFYEEYDALNESGLLFELTVDCEGHPSLIPANELSELRGIIEMKKNDVFTNYTNPQTYISNQIERITDVTSITLKPFMEKISEKVENMTKNDIEKFVNRFEKVLKRIK